MRIRRTLISAVVLISCVYCFAADSDVEKVQLEELTKRKAATLSDIKAVQAEMLENAKSMRKFKHEKIYASGSKVALIHKEIVELERQLVDKRKQLEEELANFPEMKEFTDKRNWLHEKKKGLLDRSVMIDNAIKALRYKMGENSEKGEE